MTAVSCGLQAKSCRKHSPAPMNPARFELPPPLLITARGPDAREADKFIRIKAHRARLHSDRARDAASVWYEQAQQPSWSWPHVASSDQASPAGDLSVRH